MQIVVAVMALGLIGLVFGLLLAGAASYFYVKTDPRVDAVKEVLPGANCGACGYAGCVNFAEAVVGNEVSAAGCIPGGEETANAVAEVLGLEGVAAVPQVAVVFCIGSSEHAADTFLYTGVSDCAVAEKMYGGHKACSYGCLGLGNCVRVCPFEALSMTEQGLPLVDVEACTGCGLCVGACPRGIIKTLPRSTAGHLVLCSSQDRGKTVSRACTVGCIACRACVKACPREAIAMDDKLAVIDLEKCDDCGACVEACPPGTIFPRSNLPLPGLVGTAACAAAGSETGEG